MIAFPNAKLNLGLDIVERRTDGYHNIVSVFVPLGWHDVLEIVPSQGSATTLSVSGRPCNCPPEENLVMRAYRALAERMGSLPPVDIYLRKIIPDGAGLGGGSSDAAFTLRMLNTIFALGLSVAELADTAAGLGADCAFFIYNRPMLATGTGSILTPVELIDAEMNVAVVKPPIHISTREAYAGVTPRSPERNLAEDIINLEPAQWRERVKNDFEPALFEAYPRLREIKESLYAMGAEYASMSGSGSSIYAIFSPDKTPTDIADTFTDCDTLIHPLQVNFS